MITRKKALHYLTAIVLTLGIALRFLYLDADPQYYDWIGYIPDEGRWIYQAREMFLFHTISRDYLYEIHLILAPLFQLVNYCIFNLLGVSSMSSRIFTAFCGSAMLLLFWTHLHRKVTPLALFVGVMLLAVQVDFVVLSRLAVPEMVILFFQALAFFSFLSGELSRRRMVMLGVLILVVTGMKGTTVFFLGIFSLMIFLMPRTSEECAGRSRRCPNLLWFWSGFAVPVLILCVVWVGCCAPESSVHLFEKFSDTLHFSTLSRFVRFSDAYDSLSFFFQNSLNPALYILAIGLWLSWLGWTAADRDDVDTLTRRFLVTSTIWIVAYLALILALAYFPQRYVMHIFLPMVINITIGISLLQKVGSHKVLASLQCKDRVQLLRLVVFVLPSAVFLAPLLASVFAFGGIDPDRLRSQLACFALALVVTTYIARQIASRERALKFFLVFPLIQASLWIIWFAARADASLWPAANGDLSHGLYLGSVAVATMATLVVTSTGRGVLISTPGLITIYAFGYLMSSIIRLAPAYLEPQFTIRDTSRDLGVFLDGESSITTHSAESLFNDNLLRYQRFDRNDQTHNAAEIVVSVYDHNQEEGEILDKQYHVIKTGVLYVSPQYHETHPAALLPTMVVYKKNQ